jgi:fluoroquinolone resistance protein
MDHFIQDKTFDKTNFTKGPFLKGEYENCTFNNCDLSNCDLGDTKFIECQFTGCNLSMAKLSGTLLRDVRFKDCKMLGLFFDSCDQFGLAIQMDGCILDHSSFYKVKLVKTTFRNTQLHEADLTECDLTGSVFDNCDLALARFDNTILEKADLRTAYNYSIDPDRNKIRKAKFSLPAATGLLDKYDIEIS